MVSLGKATPTRRKVKLPSLQDMMKIFVLSFLSINWIMSRFNKQRSVRNTMSNDLKNNAPSKQEQNVRKSPEKSKDYSEVHLEWFNKSQPRLSDWPVLKTRNDVPSILEKLKFKRGVEVGVQKGLLAKRTLREWKSCEEYKLVDLWGREEGYNEPNSRAADVHNRFLNEARNRMKPWMEKGVPEFFIMRSTAAAKLLKDNYFDYIYIDARHDYCAVVEDIDHYYPKLRPGGILGGHDYIDAQYAIDKLGDAEDWSTCEDGSVHPEAVKGAVDKFVKEKGLYVVTSKEGFPSWYFQKPYD